MTKEELEQLRSLKIEIKELEAELRNIPKTTDSVRGSTVNHPYIEHTMKRIRKKSLRSHKARE